MITTDPTVTGTSPEAVVITEAPRWARITAHITALLALPSGLWRIGLVLGFPLGHTEQGLRDLVGTSWWGPTSMVAISVLSEVAALLTLGLVQRWGVITPPWIPFVGARIIPRKAVLAAAWTGVAILAAIWTQFLFWWSMPGDGMTPTGQLLIGFLYLPLVAWAPLLAAVTLSYQRRRH